MTVLTTAISASFMTRSQIITVPQSFGFRAFFSTQVTSSGRARMICGLYLCTAQTITLLGTCWYNHITVYNICVLILHVVRDRVLRGKTQNMNVKNENIFLNFSGNKGTLNFPWQQFCIWECLPSSLAIYPQIKFIIILLLIGLVK